MTIPVMLFDVENPDHFTVMVVEVVDVAVTEVGPAGTEMYNNDNYKPCKNFVSEYKEPKIKRKVSYFRPHSKSTLQIYIPLHVPRIPVSLKISSLQYLFLSSQNLPITYILKQK